MNGSIRLVEERQNSALLGWRSLWKLEASFWTGIAVIAWEATPLRFYMLAELAPIAEWIALGLAGIAVITAIQVKRRLRRRLEARKQIGRRVKAPNPLSLKKLIEKYGVEEFRSMYLYMPMPKRARHEAAWAWIDALEEQGLIIGDPWDIKVEHVKETVRKSHAHLFIDGVERFDVYRLDWQALNEIMGEELNTPPLKKSA